jgi:hypothetical protein
MNEVVCDTIHTKARLMLYAGSVINQLEVKTMLWTILVILLVLWALGMVTSNSMGGAIHVLLLIAVAVFVIRLIQGRRMAG